MESKQINVETLYNKSLDNLQTLCKSAVNCTVSSIIDKMDYRAGKGYFSLFIQKPEYNDIDLTHQVVTELKKRIPNVWIKQDNGEYGCGGLEVGWGPKPKIGFLFSLLGIYKFL